MEGSRPLCFVLMWFDPSRKPVFNYAIEPAAEKCGYHAMLVNELSGSFSIVDEVIEHIFDADIVIADLTGSRPNVFYEMGVSHVLGNKTILICDHGDWEDIPFDVRGFRVVRYSLAGDGLEKLRQDLERHIRAFPSWRKRPSGNPVQRARPCLAMHTKRHEELVNLEKAYRQATKERDGAYAQLKQAKLTISRLHLDDLWQEVEALKQTLSDLQGEHPEPVGRLEELEKELKQERRRAKLLSRELKEYRALESPLSQPQTDHILCFVAMPFAAEYDGLLQALRRVLETKPYFWQLLRSDEMFFHGRISDNVQTWIDRAHCYVMEISKRNSNVMMELGYAYWRYPERPLLLLRRQGDERQLADLAGSSIITFHYRTLSAR